jgi:hypothetical protein
MAIIRRFCLNEGRLLRIVRTVRTEAVSAEMSLSLGCYFIESESCVKMC